MLHTLLPRPSVAVAPELHGAPIACASRLPAGVALRLARARPSGALGPEPPAWLQVTTSPTPAASHQSSLPATSVARRCRAAVHRGPCPVVHIVPLHAPAPQAGPALVSSALPGELPFMILAPSPSAQCAARAPPLPSRCQPRREGPLKALHLRCGLFLCPKELVLHGLGPGGFQLVRCRVRAATASQSTH